jgi:hypothetical protein
MSSTNNLIRVAGVKGSVQLQDILYVEKQLGYLGSVTYVGGGTAGSEQATIDGNAITVTIEDNVSTANGVYLALIANPVIYDRVTITMNGTSTTAQRIGVGIVLAGGTEAVYASKVIGKMKFKAATAGADGNSITVQYQEGTKGLIGHGDEIAALSTDGTTVVITICPSGSYIEDIVHAIAASGTVAAVVSGYPAGEEAFKGAGVFQQYNLAYSGVYLENGADASVPHATIQGITISGKLENDLLNDTSIILTAGGTAGSETVTVASDSGTIEIELEEGVSTATQLLTALNAESTFTDSFTANAIDTAAIWSTNAVEPSGRTGDAWESPHYYTDSTSNPLSSSLTPVSFGFNADTIILTNRETSGTKTIEYSFDGSTKHGELVVNQYEPIKTISDIISSRIWLRYSGSAPSYTLEAC